MMVRCVPARRSRLTLSILAAWLFTLAGPATLAIDDSLTKGVTNNRIYEGHQLHVVVLEPGGTLERCKSLNAPPPDPTFDACTSAYRGCPIQESDLRVASLILVRTESPSPKAVQHDHVCLYSGTLSHTLHSEDTP